MEAKIKELEKRIKYLELEILHGGYHDGWTLEGFKKELVIARDRLARLKDRL